jgi:hypothetical protein
MISAQCFQKKNLIFPRESTEDSREKIFDFSHRRYTMFSREKYPTFQKEVSNVSGGSIQRFRRKYPTFQKEVSNVSGGSI